jgi:hypothetical protein
VVKHADPSGPLRLLSSGTDIVVTGRSGAQYRLTIEADSLTGACYVHGAGQASLTEKGAQLTGVGAVFQQVGECNYARRRLAMLTYQKQTVVISVDEIDMAGDAAHASSAAQAVYFAVQSNLLSDPLNSMLDEGYPITAPDVTVTSSSNFIQNTTAVVDIDGSRVWVFDAFLPVRHPIDQPPDQALIDLETDLDGTTFSDPPNGTEADWARTRTESSLVRLACQIWTRSKGTYIDNDEDNAAKLGLLAGPSHPVAYALGQNLQTVINYQRADVGTPDPNELSTATRNANAACAAADMPINIP